ncbi:glycosyltransferase family 2 protein [Methylocapsa sp. S129]|uniref:glycosyltransferase n=1 Tax=Methylocapsa sp. S129 TaxID=1641869 RepID=UPI00131B6092|nr:glycosyltransferase family 2 protein [Methylocapsa sp. S129]
MNDRAAPILSVIVPTYREAANVPVLFERLKAVLADLAWEMIVVDDDSPDGTADIAFGLAARDPRLRCIRRVKRLGLAGAVIEGILSSSAEFVAVIDGDLQHDEAILPAMAAALTAGAADLAIGVRVDKQAGERGLSPTRQKLSDAGAWFFKRVSGLSVSDPMSGFFMIRRAIVGEIAPRLSSDGFKILADILLCAPPGLRIVETPYVFRKRRAGESKLSPLVAMDFLGLIVHHASAGILPIRFVLFAAVGGLGLVVHLSILKALIAAAALPSFSADQLVATIAAMTSNFLLNNEVTYREYRYRGWSILSGLLLFALVCSVGVVVNIDIASWLFDFDHIWWVAGFAGALVGVVWNYAVSTSFVWRGRRSG